MSSYAPWWDRKITVYNKFTASDRVVTWFKYDITDPSCFWKQLGDKVVVNGVEIDTLNIICRIPQSADYLRPMDWLQLGDKSGKFTLQVGDIIVVDGCTDTINEYEAGKHSTDLLSKYRKFGTCMEIKQVANDTMTGMVYPHYTVKGL